MNQRETDPTLSPTFTDEQWERLLGSSTERDLRADEYVVRTDDRGHPLILVISGEVDLVRDALGWSDEEVLATLTGRSFAGDVGVVTGHPSYLSVRARTPSRVALLPQAELRRVIEEDDRLGNLLLRTFWARRKYMRKRSASMMLTILGDNSTPEFVALRQFAERLDLMFTARDIGGPELPPELSEGHDSADFPIAFLRGERIARATPSEIAHRLGLTWNTEQSDSVDLVVIGGGPAGLAASIYAASEGLDTVLVDAIAPGGQAASTSRIENFPGFPFGVSGGHLVDQSALQAIKFGVRICAPCRAVSLATEGGEIQVSLAGGAVIRARAVVVASGARYRRLDLDNWNDFEPTSIFYAATRLERKAVAHAPVVVVGGANSAGQAALYLASDGCEVHLVVRGGDLRTRMSAYLVNRIVEEPRIRVHLSSSVTELAGGTVLERVRIDSVGFVDSRAVFCFIGAEPAAAGLEKLDRDDHGFIRTGVDIPADALDGWVALEREPLPFETSVPRVFAAGDIRSGSMKRVAAAIGEGSSAIASVHRALAL